MLISSDGLYHERMAGEGSYTGHEEGVGNGGDTKSVV